MKKSDAGLFIKPPKKLDCFLADSEALIKEAQALRYRVFAREMGAQLKTRSEGLDYDEVDSYCDHLLVFDNFNKKIVGYTRLLNQHQAKRLGRFYSQNEFNLDQVLALPGRFLEVGRTCVDPDYRGGAVLTTLWSALVQYAIEGEFNYLLGCASITPGPAGLLWMRFIEISMPKILHPLQFRSNPAFQYLPH